MDKRVFVEVESKDIPNVYNNTAYLVGTEELTLLLHAPVEEATEVTLIDKSNPTANAWVQLITNRGNLSTTEIIKHLSTVKIIASQKEIAERTGLYEQDVSTLLRLGTADPRLVEAVDKKEISLSAVEPLLALSLEDQAALAPSALQKKTVRGVKSLIAAHQLSKSPVLDKKETLDEEIDPTGMLVTSLLKEALNVVTQAHAIALGVTFSPFTGKEISGIIEKITSKIYHLGVTE